MDQEKSERESLIRNFDEKPSSSLFSMKFVGLILLVVVLGGLTGFILTRNKTTGKFVGNTLSTSGVSKGTTIGSDDTKTFKDSTEGLLKEGGVDGEGQFHLQRPGGESQNVYLTSSTVDLSQVVGKKIKVWGETQKAQKVGWLMDVGKIEVLN